MRLNVLILIYISLPLPEGMETRQTFAVGENKPEIWIPLKISQWCHIYGSIQMLEYISSTYRSAN